MPSIAIFNNKGGVGKTTLTCNIASYYSSEKTMRILIIDCDPQCNATQLIMGEEYTTALYWNDSPSSEITTIRDILQPIEDGDSSINKEIKPIRSSKNRFNVDLIPGHPAFSIIEDRLGSAWHDLLGGDIGGLRKTNWNTSLSRKTKDNYDLVFYDLGPSLGSINRSVLIGCDAFITPMSTDIFSILGVQNIARWMNDWMQHYVNGVNLANTHNPRKMEEYLLQISRE